MINELKAKLNNNKELVFSVKIIPGAPQTKFLTKDNNLLKISIAKPAEKGKANKELIKFLANNFSVDKSMIKIISGRQSRYKLIRIKK